VTSLINYNVVMFVMLCLKIRVSVVLTTRLTFNIDVKLRQLSVPLTLLLFNVLKTQITFLNAA